MIKPGLFTASTSSADHLGISAVCFVFLSIVVSLLFGLCVVVLSLKKTGVSLVETLATTGCPVRAPQGGTTWSTWSEVESCAYGLSWTIGAKRGHQLQIFSAGRK